MLNIYEYYYHNSIQTIFDYINLTIKDPMFAENITPRTIVLWHRNSIYSPNLNQSKSTDY